MNKTTNRKALQSKLSTLISTSNIMNKLSNTEMDKAAMSMITKYAISTLKRGEIVFTSFEIALLSGYPIDRIRTGLDSYGINVETKPEYHIFTIDNTELLLDNTGNNSSILETRDMIVEDVVSLLVSNIITNLSNARVVTLDLMHPKELVNPYTGEKSTIKATLLTTDESTAFTNSLKNANFDVIQGEYCITITGFKELK